MSPEIYFAVDDDQEEKRENAVYDQVGVGEVNLIYKIESSLQLRKKFREKIEDMDEYDQDEWKKILKSYAKLEAGVKDEIEMPVTVD